MLFDTVTALSRVYDEQEDVGPRAGAAQFQPAALAYQPIVALRTGSICGLAAVMRRRASVPAQRPDPARPIVGSVLAQACAEARYFPGLRLSVRISARQLETGALVEHVEAALGSSGLPATLLDVEFSEAGRPDLSSQQLAVLLALRERGVGIILNGFGSGGASLLSLRQLPFTAVKLDHRLVHGLPFDAKVCARVGALLEARRAAGINCIADGIETLVQRDFLTKRGCDAATGPLYSRPVAPERLAALLDYGVDTCSPSRSGSQTPDDRDVPH